MNDEFKLWRDNAKYLPEEFRDWHDQKDLFKSISPVLKGYLELHKDSTTLKDILKMTWMELQCVVIDVFLWEMAKKGYVLKRMSSAKLKKFELEDLEDD